MSEQNIMRKDDEEFGHGIRILHHTETPPPVDKMCAALRKQWDKTATDCEQRAAAFETIAAELRERAHVLRIASDKIPGEIRDAVKYELEARGRSNFLEPIR